MEKRRLVSIFSLLLFVGVVLSGDGVAKVKASEGLDLSVQFSPAITAIPGTDLSLDVILTNNTGAEVTGVDLDINFPNQFMNFVSAGGQFVCDSDGRYTNYEYCHGGVVADGTSVVVSFAGIAPDVYSQGMLLSSTASVQAYNLFSSDSIMVADAYLPDLAISATASVEDVVLGNTVTYSVRVRSDGPLDAPQSWVIARFADGSEQVAEVPALVSGEDAIVNFDYVPSVSGTSEANFVVDFDNLIDEEYEYNNQFTKYINVSEALPDLVVSVSQPSSVVYKSTFVQTLTVRKVGNVAATNIVVKDLLQNFGMTSFVADHGFSCVQTRYRVGRTASYKPNGYECSGGVLGAGEEAVLTVTMVAPSSTGTFYHSISVDPKNMIVESNELNNSVPSDLAKMVVSI